MNAERDADLTPHERTRQRRGARILDVAAELLLRHGYQRVTLEDIAQKTEIGKGTIYLHWKTKEALFGALMQREAVARPFASSRVARGNRTPGLPQIRT